MVADWLVVWGATQAVGFVFKPILEDLAQESAKDYVKDVFKDCLKKVIHLPEKDALKEAYGKALKEFLQLIQQELESADYPDEQIKLYIDPLKHFTQSPDVATALGQAFEQDCRTIDTHLLAQNWKEMNLLELPEDFDWNRVSKLYVRAVKKIIQNSDELRPIFAVQAQVATAEGVKELVGIQPDFDLQRYAEGLQEQYGNLKLESLDTTGCGYNALKLWRMFIPLNVRECQEFLPRVYEIPKEHLRRLQQSGQLEAAEIPEVELEQYRKTYFNQPSRLVWDVLGDPKAPEAKRQTSPLQYVVILGDPGSGKSTLLQYMALAWAERPQSQLDLHPIPLLIELRTYARDKEKGQCTDILSLIHSGNITCRLNQQQLHEKLKAGYAIALFDGIDEVFDPALRDAVVTDIHRFTNDYPKVQVIATSRWLGYKAQRLRDAGFRHFMLQELDEKQIKEFIERWHHLTFSNRSDKEQKQKRLQQAIEESKAIQELAGNPLLLTMMAILNRNQDLPRDRPELYNQASRVLLHQWDVERALIEDQRLDPKTIDYRNKQAMLRKVAYFMQSSEKGLAGNLISANNLENVLTDYLKTIEVEQPRTLAKLMINQLRTHNFILCDLGADSYGFVHRSFLDYFCAWEFVDQFEQQRTLTFDKLKNDVFGQHWQDETWHGVLRLIVGMIDVKFVTEIIDYLLEQNVDRGVFLGEDYRLTQEALSNLLLAANCLTEVRKKSEIASTSAKVLQSLQQKIEQERLYLNYEAAMAVISWIAAIGQESKETLLWLKNCLKFDSSTYSYVPRLAVQAIADGWKDDPDTLPWLKDRALHDEERIVRRAAVEALAQGWKDDPDTLPMLKDRALNDESGGVRAKVVEVLAQGWKDDPDTLPMLKDRALNDTLWLVRRDAVQALVQEWKDDPETLIILKDRALHDYYEGVRQVAVKAIAQGWKHDYNTLPWLKDSALHDGYASIRQAVLQAIADGWKDDPDTLPWLKNLALNHQQHDVRRVAVQVIAQTWKEHPDTFSILRDRALQDQKYYVRRAAVEAIAQGWKEHPDALSLLKDRAQHDQKHEVRQTAVQAIANGWKDDPDTLPWLKNSPLHNKNGFVRDTTVKAISNGWKDNPETVSWLKEYALNDEDSVVRRAAMQALAKECKDDPDILSLLKDRALNDEDSVVRRAAMQAITNGWRNHSDTLPLLKDHALHDEDKWVRYGAVQAIAKGWKDDPNTLSLLKDCALHDEDADVQSVAVQVIAQGWKDDPNTLLWFKGLALHGESRFVRCAAVQAIADEWEYDPDTLPWLKDRALHDEDADVRCAAVQAIAQGWEHDPDTLPWLKDRALHDEDADVRCAAVQAIAEWWPSDPDILPCFKHDALHHESDFVRGAALEAIAHGWKHDPDTLPTLKDHALNDESGAVRAKAIEVIVQGWQDDPDTLPWLKDRALHDQDGNVRCVAALAIAQGWKDGSK